mgnify:CR=1 FL=1
MRMERIVPMIAMAIGLSIAACETQPQQQEFVEPAQEVQPGLEQQPGTMQEPMMPEQPGTMQEQPGMTPENQRGQQQQQPSTY